MRSFNTNTLNALNSAEVQMRGMIRFNLLSGSYGFWDGSTDFTHDSLVYRPGGQLLEIEALGANAGLAALGVTVRLTSVPNTDLTPDVLATIENETYTGRSVLISAAYFDGEYTLLQVIPVWSGYIDKISHEITGDRAAIVAQLESKSLDHQKRGYRMRSTQDQQRLSAGDIGLEHVAIVSTFDIVWGRQT